MHSVQIGATHSKRLDTNGYKIMSNEMRDIAVVNPPYKLQNEIAKYLDGVTVGIDNAIQKIQKSVALLQEFKSSLISNVVTGKVKI